MNLTTTVTRPVSNAALLEALALVVSPVWGALSMAHRLGGGDSEAWRVLETYTPMQIADEICARDLSLDGLKAACSSVLVLDSPVTHNIFQYDPRPRCAFCARPHLVDPKTGTIASCGRAQRLFNPPAWRWTRATQEAAL